DVVSGRITPTCSVLAPFVANWVSGFSLDIVDARSTVNELTLRPAGILFEPPEDEDLDDVEDDPQPTAVTPARATATPAKPTLRRAPLPRELDCRPPSLLIRSRISLDPFRPDTAGSLVRENLPHVCPSGTISFGLLIWASCSPNAV